MTNAKLLEKLYGITEILPPQEKEIFELCRKDPGTIKTYEQFVDSLAVRLASLVFDVETDLKLEAAKSSGKLDRYKACSRILKRAMSDSRAVLHGAWIANGMQCICDSYVLVRLKDHLDLGKIPDAVAVASKTRPLLGAIYFSSSDGDCVLLPVKKAEVKKNDFAYC